jgi:hypothetical protein
MRESALFGTMFGLGAGAVLVGVTVSRLVGGQVAEKPAEEPPPVVVETAPRAVVAPSAAAAIESAAPVVSSVAPPAEVALSGQHRVLPRKHRRPPSEEAAPPTPAPIVEATPPTPAPSATGSIANREAPSSAPPRAQVDDPPVASDGPIAIVRGGVARPALRAPGARIIQVEPQGH